MSEELVEPAGKEQVIVSCLIKVAAFSHFHSLSQNQTILQGNAFAQKKWPHQWCDGGDSHPVSPFLNHSLACKDRKTKWKYYEVIKM